MSNFVWEKATFICQSTDGLRRRTSASPDGAEIFFSVMRWNSLNTAFLWHGRFITKERSSAALNQSRYRRKSLDHLIGRKNKTALRRSKRRCLALQTLLQERWRKWFSLIQKQLYKRWAWGTQREQRLPVMLHNTFLHQWHYITYSNIIICR